MTVQQLRKRHPRFIYQKYTYEFERDGLAITFYFKIEPDILFAPKIFIRNIDKKYFESIDKGILDNLIFHLGLAEIPTYWKSTCSPEIFIACGHLSAPQRTWWKSLTERGLGEFFYVNHINFSGKNFFTITSAANKNIHKRTASLNKRGGDAFLVPMGGGKDSLVTVEILKRAGKKFRTMVLGNVPAALHAAAASHNVRPIRVDRTIDQKLLLLNKQGYLNGHTPFSSYLAFLSTLCGVLFGYHTVVLSQERSANENNTKFKHHFINHQYSKSFAFEKKFRAYAKKYLAADISYFSILRPLYEIQIAQAFSRFPKYFRTFRSCNVGLKRNVWCGHCAKCLAIYILLSPFLPHKTLVKIFRKDLFRDESLWPEVLALLGRSDNKPFECVSTKKETSLALSLALQKYASERRPLPVILRRFNNEPSRIKKNIDKRAAEFFSAWDANNFLPKDLKIVIEKMMKIR